MDIVQNKNRNKNIALLSITIALIIVLQALAEVIQLFGLQISLALGLIPVLVIAQLKGWKMGALAGLAFGLVSMTIALIRYLGVPVFQNVINPLISVLPRVLVGIVAGALAGLFNKIERKMKESPKPQTIVRKYFFSAIATLAGVLTNTIGFLGMFYLFSAGQSIGNYTINITYIVGMIIAINTVVEAVSYVFIVPAIVEILKTNKAFTDINTKERKIENENND
jgi:uncharacterized membrane protein